MTEPALQKATFAAGCFWSVENKFSQQVLNRAFAGGFSMALMVKDLKTALEVAQATGMPTPLADVTVDTWVKAEALLGGLAIGGLDFRCDALGIRLEALHAGAREDRQPLFLE